MHTSTRRIAACAMAALLIAALPASAQIVITGDDDVNFKLGVLGQFQADTITNPDAESNTNNLFARRLRLLFGGQVAKNVSFFIETDAPPELRPADLSVTKKMRAPPVVPISMVAVSRECGWPLNETVRN
jgi:hypothetical protein